MPHPSINRRRQTLLATYLLLSTNAQDLIPKIDPLKDGILIRPLDDGSGKYVMYDFKPAFPPYTKESLREVLLLRGEEGDDREEVQENETDRLSSEDDVSADLVEAARNEPMNDEVGSTVPLVETDDEKDDADLQVDASIRNEGVSPDNDSADGAVDEREDTAIDSEIQDDGEPTSDSDPDYMSTSTQATEAPVESEETSQAQSANENNVQVVVDEIPNDGTSASTETSEIENDSLTAEAVAESMGEEINSDIVHEFSSEDDVIESTSGGDIISDTTDAGTTDEIEIESVVKHPVVELDDTDSESYSTAEELLSESGTAESSPETDLFRDNSNTNVQQDETTHQTADKITINYDESPPISNLNKDEDANREFVTGLDEIDKFFESVSPPDELDVGADGSSMQDVLVGQGLKIIFKRAKSIGSSVKERFEKIVEKALPQQLVNLAGKNDDEEEESLEDIFKMMKGDVPLNTKNNAADETKKTNKAKEEQSKHGEQDKLENRFPLLKKPQVNKIYKYAKRKWQQAKHLFDDLMSIFGGEDEEDIDFSADFSRMNFDDVRSLVQKNRIKSDGAPQFGSEIEDSFVRSRYDAMMRLQEKRDSVEDA
jgi:hypothetical protein